MFRWLVRSAMEAMLPAEAGLPGVADCAPDLFITRISKEACGRLWWGMVAAGFAFQLLPVVVVGIPLPAFLLSPRARDRYAFKLSTHRSYLIRQVAFIAKFAAGLCWGGHDSVREALALPPYATDPGTWRAS